MFGASPLRLSAALAAVVAGRPPFSLAGAAAPGAVGPAQMKLLGTALFLVASASAFCADEDKVYCMDGLAYTDDTFQDQITPTRTCYEECGSNCCTGASRDGNNPCDGGRFTVCKDGSCSGSLACHGVGGNGGAVGLISGASCIGERACEYAGAEQGFVGYIHDSCKPTPDGFPHPSSNAVNACAHLGREWNIWNLPNVPGRVEGVTSSCKGSHACFYVGKGGRMGLISDSSCIGGSSCLEIAHQRGEVGSISGGSCQNTHTNDSMAACKWTGKAGGTVGNIGGGSCIALSACQSIASSSGNAGNILEGSCVGDYGCQGLAYGGGRVGNIYDSCQGEGSCTNMARGSSGFGHSLVQCCNSNRQCYETAKAGWGGAPPLDPACTANTIPPTQAPTPLYPPTQAPTVAGPWTVDYDDTEANFTSGASNELEVGFFVGVGREVAVEVFETCDEDADQVPSDIYSKTVSHVPGFTNLTHSKIIVGYNFDKARMIDSSLWNATSETLTFCQVTSLTTPDPSDPSGDAWVITSDRREIELRFDLDANFEVSVDLADRTINNETETISYDDEVEAYKCRGGSDNSFIPERGALPPNTQLAVCIRIKDNNTSVNIDRLADMIITQDGSQFVAVEDGTPKIGDLTKMPEVPEGVIVKTMVPLSVFNFENDKSLNISGTVELELSGSPGRKLRALARENDVAGKGREKAGYDIIVSLQSTADGFDPIGSSGGHAIVGKRFPALGLMVVAAIGLMM